MAPKSIDIEGVQSPEVRQLVRTWLALMAAHASLVERLDRNLRTEQGLSAGQFEILARLFHGPPDGRRMHEMAAELFISRSAATRMMDALESKGLIRREVYSHDRRGTLARLTEPGRAAFLSATTTFLESAETSFSKVGESRRLEALYDALEAIAREP